MGNERPLRILIGTPCGGGVVTAQYLLSIMKTWDDIRKQKIPIDLGLYTLANESLISRGRNHIAAVAMYQKWDKLFFIDADAGWTFEQFLAIATSEKPLIAGICPLKIPQVALNYLPKECDEKYHPGHLRSMAGLRAMRTAHATPEINVGYVGTAFLCIDVAKVLMPLAEVAEPFRYPNPATGKVQTHWDFFSTRPINKECMSEDWGFLAFARRHGIEPYINADVIIEHTGTHTFRAGASTNPTEQAKSYQSLGQ